LRKSRSSTLKIEALLNGIEMIFSGALAESEIDSITWAYMKRFWTNVHAAKPGTATHTTIPVSGAIHLVSIPHFVNINDRETPIFNDLRHRSRFESNHSTYRRRIGGERDLELASFRILVAVLQ
jgi:3-dehydroquinate dehydratase